MDNVQSTIQSLQKIFLDYPKRLEQAKQDYQESCSERNDILHALEFGTLNAAQMSKLMRDLRETQQRRRRLKNEIEVLETIVKFTLNPQKPNKHRINSLVGNVNAIITHQSQRTYTMRVRTDLQAVVKDA